MAQTQSDVFRYIGATILVILMLVAAFVFYGVMSYFSAWGAIHTLQRTGNHDNDLLAADVWTVKKGIAFGNQMFVVVYSVIIFLMSLGVFVCFGGRFRPRPTSNACATCNTPATDQATDQAPGADRSE